MSSRLATKVALLCSLLGRRLLDDSTAMEPLIAVHTCRDALEYALAPMSELTRILGMEKLDVTRVKLWSLF